jgi:hypothetical protein
MKLLITVILLFTIGITAGLAQLGSEQVFITVTSEGKAKVSQSLFPETFVSTIDVNVISEKISNLLAIDEENILLGTSQNQDLLKIATLGASSVNLKYNADILSYESGVFKLKYNSELESRVNLPPLSKLVSLNTIPIEITDEEYILPPGEISISFSIRPVTSKEFFVPVDDSQYKIEAITAAKIEGFSANSEQIQFIIKDKAIVLTIIPTKIMANPNDALLNGEKVDFTQFHKNSTHSWIRIDPHEKGLVKILDTTEKTEEGGGCLIATATYGTEMAPQVQFLREIRDNQLMNIDSGVSFIAGFNSLYYSFSPHVADLERENPLFKEIVKIGITPLLSSLFVMEYAETDEEILGLGISVIIMNIGMYFIFPFVICYQGRRILRTRRLCQSSLVVISNCSYRSVVKIGIIGLIALFVLTVSVPSAFAQSTESETGSPIIMVLEITHQNILDSLEDAEINPEDDPYYTEAKIQYDAAIAALNEDDVEDAKNSALIAMALFEKSAEEIGALENQASTQLPPGSGAGIGSVSDIGVSQGQGLGVGGVPPGIFNQISASNTFAVSEAITSIDEEVDQYRELAKLNNLDGIDFGEFDESVNLAKTLLANGVVPDAQVKLELANQIKDDILQKIQDAANENSAAEIEQYMDEQKNLGLTQKDIRELNNILEDITTEDNEETEDNGVPVDSGDEAPGNSGEAPGQNKADSGDEAPGNSGEALGQNKDSSEDETDLPPGFDAATENGDGLGIGKIPPGLSKLFGNNDADLPPGFDAATENGDGLGIGKVPPGQIKKFDSYEASFEQSPDDFYENSFEASIDGVFEMNFDGTNKGNGDGKGKFGAWTGKSGENPSIKAAKDAKNRNSNNGKGADTIICHFPNTAHKTLKLSGSALTPHLNHGDPLGACLPPGITDGEANVSGIIGTLYTVQGLTALSNSYADITSSIRLDVKAPNGTNISGPPQVEQPYSFTPDTNGDWDIEVTATGFTYTRTVTVTGQPTANAGSDDAVAQSTNVVLSGSSTCTGTCTGTLSLAWVITSEPTGAPGTLNDETTPTPNFNANKVGTYVLTLTATQDNGYYAVDTVTITVS